VYSSRLIIVFYFNIELLGIFFFLQKKVTDTLKFLNDIELNEQLDIFENDLPQIIYSEAPCEELHLVYLKAAMHCYKNKWYIKGAEICQIARTVLNTPMILILLAKCLIEVIF